MAWIETVEQLEALYGAPNDMSIIKESGRIIPEYRAYIEASPFVALATVGAEGLDCSPRGDRGEVVRIHDARTLMLADRRGNNRLDSLRNIVSDPRVALLFLIPGSVNTLRVNGRARLSIAPGLLKSFEVDGKAPRSVAVIAIDTVYFQCGRAIVRSELWNPERLISPGALPSAGQMLAAMSQGRLGGQAYDEEWPERAAKTLW